MARRHYEHPLRRSSPSGATRWVARFTGRDGKRRSAGTFEKRGPCKEPGVDCCAQQAIDRAYEAEFGGRAPRTVGTVERYVEHWKQFQPRSERTARTYGHNLKAALDVKVGGRPSAWVAARRARALGDRRAARSPAARRWASGERCSRGAADAERDVRGRGVGRLDAAQPGHGGSVALDGSAGAEEAARAARLLVGGDARPGRGGPGSVRRGHDALSLRSRSSAGRDAAARARRRGR
jgi:hypothetical protein